MWRLSPVASPNFCIPISQPVLTVLAQQVPIHGQASERFIHPGRQLLPIEVCARRNSIVSTSSVNKAFRCGYKLVEASCLVCVWCPSNYCYPVRHHGSATSWNPVGDWHSFLSLVQLRIRHIPETNQSFTASELLHQQGRVCSILMHI